MLAAVVAVSCVVLAACATVVAGTSPVPPPRQPDRIDPNTYSQRVSAADKVVLELAERLRRLDPCGLMPEAVVAHYGDVRRFGPEEGFDSCTAVLRPPGDDGDMSITLDLSAPARDEVDRPFRFGHKEIQRSRIIGESTAECTVRFVLDLPVTAFVDSEPPAREATVRAVEDFPAGVAPDSQTVCEAAERTHKVAVEGLRALPARPVSGPGRIRLAAADPCEIVGWFAPEDLVNWAVDADPYRCDYSVRIPGGGAQTWTVRFGLEPEAEPEAGPAVDLLTAAGHSIVVRRDGDGCTVATPVEGTVDTNRVAASVDTDRVAASVDEPVSGRNVPTVVVSSTDSSCGGLPTLAAELADLALT